MIYQRLRERLPTISIDTIYRTLTTLASHGLISRVETAENLSRFEVTRFAASSPDLQLLPHHSRLQLATVA